MNKNTSQALKLRVDVLILFVALSVMISTRIIERHITVGRWKLPLLVRSGIFCFFVSSSG